MDNTLEIYDRFGTSSSYWANVPMLKWLGWPIHDEEITKFSNQFNCTVMFKADDEGEITYRVANDIRLYSKPIRRIILEFETNEDAMIFKLKYL
jgi:hypothetical protein